MIAAAGWIAALAIGVWVLRLRSMLAWRAELVTRACHELRGPVTVARLGMELIAREREVSPAAIRAIDLELASAGVALEDLRAASSGLSGPWRIDAVDITALLADSCEAFRPLALARGVELDLRWRGESTIIRADRLRLAQATGNLIANAIEHGEGQVALSARTGDDRVEIEVADAGHGLPAPLADITAGARGGRGRRGRGLAIAADIAQRHGGHLTADTAAGSRLTLKLPTKPS